MDAHRIKILIVDDDFSSRRLLARFICNEWPFKILEAQEGSEALRIILKESPNLVLLDMKMPFMSGLEVLKTMRGSSRMSSTPVIACTAVDDKTEVSEILKYGINDYIIKPVDRKTLLKKIANLFNLSDNSDAENPAS